MDKDQEIEKPETYRDVIKRTIEEQVLYGLDENQLEEVRHSQHVRLAESLLEKAAEYAKKQDISVDDYEWNLAAPAILFLSDLSYCFVDCEEKDAKKKFDKKFNYWRHNIYPVYPITNKNTPHMDRFMIEAAVGDYLELPFRDERIDRILVDILIAMELYAYGNEVYNSKGIPGLPSLSAFLKINPLRYFLKGHLLSALFFIGGAVAFVFAGIQNWISEGLAIAIAALLVVLFFGFLLRGLVNFPKFRIALSEAQELAHGMLDAMFGLYAEMNSDGPISAKHIRETAQKATDKGVVWPGPLFALLDDVIARTGRL